MTAPLRVLVVEDEPPARRHLCALLAAEGDVVIAGECGDGVTAIEQLRTLAPDLVFLDVQIPEPDGLAVIERVGVERMPGVIFVTAYDAFAVRAFEVHAIDYLLKPLHADRLHTALERARAALRQGASPTPRLAGLVETMRAGAPADRLAVRERGRILLVPFADIDYVTAEGAYLRVHTKARSYLVRERMGTLEERLAGRGFARVHRSLIVNLERVRELEPLYRGEYVLRLAGGTRLVTGRTYRAQVQQVFGL